eukprot:7236426-Pyramimonas_sp.AAC.1
MMKQASPLAALDGLTCYSNGVVCLRDASATSNYISMEVLMNDEYATHYVIAYYQDYDDDGEELIGWTHDAESGLHYRECWTETGEISYGAYGDDGVWYESNEIEAWLTEMDLDQAYQMSGFRPRFRFGGYRRKK